MTAEWTPDCMDGEELADWQRLNRSLAAKGNRADRPCADCLPAFAMEMRGEGRCNGTPMGHAKDEDLIARARSFAEKRAMALEEKPMPEPVTSLSSRRLPVSIVAPCGTCSHEAVCALKPLIAGVRSLDVVAPASDPAITFALSAKVTCAHYRKGASAKPAVATEDDAERERSKMNLTPEERERRRQQALRMAEANRARREQAAS